MGNDPSVHNYYRHFEAPGVGHCWSGTGLYPAEIFEAMVNWVEKGKVPEKLETSASVWTNRKTRILCPYPAKEVYRKGANPNSIASYACE